MGRSRRSRHRIKSIDPFSKTGGKLVHGTGGGRGLGPRGGYDLPPSREEEAGAILGRDKGGVVGRVGLKRRRGEEEGVEKGGGKGGGKRRKEGGEEDDLAVVAAKAAAAALEEGAEQRTAAAMAVSAAARQRIASMRLAPGESLAHFRKRLKATVRAAKAAAPKPLAKGPTPSVKAHHDRRKERERAKKARQAALRLAKQRVGKVKSRADALAEPPSTVEDVELEAKLWGDKSHVPAFGDVVSAPPTLTFDPKTQQKIHAARFAQEQDTFGASTRARVPDSIAKLFKKTQKDPETNPDDPRTAKSHPSDSEDESSPLLTDSDDESRPGAGKARPKQRRGRRAKPKKKDAVDEKFAQARQEALRQQVVSAYRLLKAQRAQRPRKGD